MVNRIAATDPVITAVWAVKFFKNASCMLARAAANTRS